MPTLPGQFASHTGTNTCDHEDGCEALATQRMTGETDSMGSEYFYFCEHHADLERAALKSADTSGQCDWCKQHAPRLSPHRDFEEGCNGRVYDVCAACLRAESERLSEELSFKSSDGDHLMDADEPDDDDWLPEEPEDDDCDDDEICSSCHRQICQCVVRNVGEDNER